MPTRKRPHAAGRDLCAQPHEDDGINPREWTRGSRDQNGTSRKDLQLCKQVRLAVESALAQWNDSLLMELVVVSTEPAPDARRIRIVLAAPPRLYLERESDLRARLLRAHAFVRAAAAQAVCRKRSPQVLLELVPVQPESTDA